MEHIQTSDPVTVTPSRSVPHNISILSGQVQNIRCANVSDLNCSDITKPGDSKPTVFQIIP